MCSVVATRRRAKATSNTIFVFGTRVPIDEKNWFYYETNKSVDLDCEFDKAITFYKSEKENLFDK